MSQDTHIYSLFRSGFASLRNLRLTEDDMRAIVRIVRAHVETLDSHDDPRWWELADELETFCRTDEVHHEPR